MVVGLIALMGECGVRNIESQGWPKVGGVAKWYVFSTCLLPSKNVDYF